MFSLENLLLQMMKKYLHKIPLKLESGGMLPEVEIAYHTIGNLNASRSNVVWIFHALTGNSDAQSWWEGLVGENTIFNSEKYFIVCANVLGSTYGTTGPTSINPATNQPYYHSFPRITIRDMVNVHDLLRDHLGIRRIYLGIGGSMGGQQLLEWAVLQPRLFERLCLIATNAKHSAWGIAFNETQRMAIENDASWRESNLNSGMNGMKNARAIALLSYRNYNAYEYSQTEISDEVYSNFKASCYQRYQGEKLASRFNAYSYYALSLAMDSHNVGRHRESVGSALSQINAHALVVGITSDLLFPVSEQRLIAQEIRNSELVLIESVYGHDGFLVETKKLSEIISHFLKEQIRIPVGHAEIA